MLPPKWQVFSISLVYLEGSISDFLIVKATAPLKMLVKLILLYFIRAQNRYLFG